MVCNLFVVTCLVSTAYGQLDSTRTTGKQLSDCEAKLSLATSEFNAGRFFGLPAILDQCLKDGFTKEQKVRAYILLCQVHLINDNPSEAEAGYLNLLHADPEYIANTDQDPVDVVFLSRKFTTRPVITPHIRAGLNTSIATVIHQNTSDPYKIVTTDYQMKVGFSIGGGVLWNISDRVGLGLDVVWSHLSYQKTTENLNQQDRGLAVYRLNRLDLPLFLSYQDDVGKWRPFGYVGYATHLALGAKASLGYTNVDGEGEERETEVQVENLKSLYNQLNHSLVVGGGLKYKVGKNYVFADLRCYVGLSQVSKEGVLFTSTGVSHGAFEDAYRLSAINLSVGYVIPYYNPRKKNVKFVKGFLGKILYGNRPVTE